MWLLIVISICTKEQPREIKPVKLNITPNKKQETAPVQSIYYIINKVKQFSLSMSKRDD